MAYEIIFGYNLFCSVRSQDDVLDDSSTFSPEYTHQVFGEKEVIFGYKNLKIKVQTPVCQHVVSIGLNNNKICP